MGGRDLGLALASDFRHSCVLCSDLVLPQDAPPCVTTALVTGGAGDASFFGGDNELHR
jgi:hypothetical protein